MAKRKLFEEFNEMANYNLGNGGNISLVVSAYTNLAHAMGKDDVAKQMISELPPSEALNHPDNRLDNVVSAFGGLDTPVYEQEQKTR